VANVGADIAFSAGTEAAGLTALAPPPGSESGVIEVVDGDRSHTRPAPPGEAARLHWRSLSEGILVGYLTAAPVLFACFILRDQREGIWIVLLPIAGAGFLIGGAIAGRHRRLARGAMRQGEICGLLTATVIVVANAIRAVVLGHGISPLTVLLWLSVEGAAVFVAAVGARIGRRRYLRSRRRKAVLT
jgi:hypothetical protein